MHESDIKHRKESLNWAFLFGFLVLLFVVMRFVVPFVEDKINDIRYGNIRTHTIAFDLNPTDDLDMLTYFTAQNVEGRIVVFAVSPLPSSQTLELKGPELLGSRGRSEPVVLSRQLVNEDPYPDLVMYIDGQPFVYLADGGTLREPTAQERSILYTK